MASVTFGYDGAGTLTATVTGATVGKSYKLLCEDSTSTPDTQVAASSTVNLSISSVSNGGGSYTRSNAWVWEDPDGTFTEPAYDVIGATVVKFDTAGEYVSSGSISYDGDRTVTVVFSGVAGDTYGLGAFNDSGSLDFSNTVATGASQTFTHTLAAKPTRGVFAAEFWKGSDAEIAAAFSPNSTAIVDSNTAAAAGTPGVSDGVWLAFDDATLEPSPTWTLLNALDGMRVQQYTIRRGRSFELDEMEAGTAEITIVDREGVLDPTNPSSEFYGKLEPRIQAKITLQHPISGAQHTLYRGYVEDFDYTLDKSQLVNVLKLSLTDARSILGAVEMAPGTAGTVPPPAGSEGNVFYDDASVDDRIIEALADAGWPSDLQEIFSGNVTVQESVYSPGESILAVIQEAADAEFPGVANFYVSRDGVVTFHGRLARFDHTNPDYGIASWKAGDGAAVHASPSDTAHARSMSFNRGMARVINAALAYPQGIARADIAAQVTTDSTSISKYGLCSWSAPNLRTLAGLLTGNDANDETKLFADYYVANYKNPRNRINQLTFRTMHPDWVGAEATWDLICEVELNDYIEVTVEHPSDGGFSLEPCFVEGITYEAVKPMTPDYHEVTLTLDLSPVGYFSDPAGLDGVT